MRKYVKTGAPLIILATLIATGCSFGSKDAATNLDAPPVNYVEEGEIDLDETEAGEEGEEAGEEEGAEKAEQTAETVERELYLIDANGMVVPQTLTLPKQEGVLKQSLEYLVEDGPVSELLPSGFQAVLPAGTVVDVNLKEDEKTAIADFSKEFELYDGNKEQQVLQAITWTLTQFESVEKVQIRINGYDQEVMPQHKTPIGDGVSRSDGINLESNQVVDLVNSEEVLLYFLGHQGETSYYVPVTRRVEAGDNILAAAVNELIDGPSLGTQLLSSLQSDVKLLDTPVPKDGTLTLNFDNTILDSLENMSVSQEVLNMLALTLTEQDGIEKISIEVNGEASVLNQEGEPAEAVSRPKQVNDHPL
ncbi:GerMN domain-containing protein [Alkalicoccobacillus murimartini]|uniref:Germination protein M n=1 Tax=Alkalicoccobacillus murimartini TaxID=171685 RepID=A0ABT9YJM7_9BACI|nr:GerMN domain-containing protein [Alkalicoccobacillus murimartini]MDQ0208043.1 germination protein M [Alkalicoccobacillus murimartini]